jgi:hypothetical protein
MMVVIVKPEEDEINRITLCSQSVMRDLTTVSLSHVPSIVNSSVCT